MDDDWDDDGPLLPPGALANVELTPPLTPRQAPVPSLRRSPRRGTRSRADRSDERVSALSLAALLLLLLYIAILAADPSGDGVRIAELERHLAEERGRSKDLEVEVGRLAASRESLENALSHMKNEADRAVAIVGGDKSADGQGHPGTAGPRDVSVWWSTIVLASTMLISAAVLHDDVGSDWNLSRSAAHLTFCSFLQDAFRLLFADADQRSTVPPGYLHSLAPAHTMHDGLSQRTLDFSAPETTSSAPAAHLETPIGTTTISESSSSLDDATLIFIAKEGTILEDGTGKHPVAAVNVTELPDAATELPIEHALETRPDTLILVDDLEMELSHAAAALDRLQADIRAIQPDDASFLDSSTASETENELELAVRERLVWQNRVVGLEAELTLARQACAELLAEAESLRDVLAVEHDRQLQLSAQVVGLRNDMEAARLDAEHAEQNVSTLTEELATQQAVKDMLASKEESLRSELDNARKAAEQLMAEVDAAQLALEQALAEESSRNGALRDHVQTGEERLEILRQDSRQMQDEIELVEGSIVRESAEAEELDKKLQLARQNLAELSHVVSQTQSEINATADEVEKQGRLGSELTDRVARLSEELSVKQAANAGKESELHVLEQTLEGEILRTDSLSARLVEVSARLQAQQEETSKLELQVLAGKNALAAQDQAVQDLNAAVALAEEQLRAASDASLAAQKRLADFESRISEENMRSETLSSQARIAEADFAKLCESNDSLQSRVAQLDMMTLSEVREADVLATKLRLVEHDLASAEIRKEEAQDRLSELNAALIAESEQGDTIAAVSTKEAELSGLRDTNAGLLARIAEMHEASVLESNQADALSAKCQSAELLLASEKERGQAGLLHLTTVETALAGEKARTGDLRIAAIVAEGELIATRNANAQIESDISSLNSKLSSEVELSEQLRTKLRDVEAAVVVEASRATKISAQIVSSEDRHRSFSETNIAAHRQLTDLLGLIAAADVESGNLESATVTATASLENIQQSIAGRRGLIEQLRNQMDAEGSVVKELEEKLEAAHSAVETQRLRKDQLTTQLAAAENEIRSAVEINGTLEDHVNDLDARNASELARTAELRAVADATSKQLEEISKSNAMLEAEIARLNAAVVSARTRQTNLDIEYKSAENRVLSEEQQEQVLVERILSMQDRLSSLVEANEANRARLVELDDSILFEVGKDTELSNAVLEAEERLRTLRTSATELEEQLSRLNIAAASENHRVRGLEANLKAVEDAIGEELSLKLKLSAQLGSAEESLYSSRQTNEATRIRLQETVASLDAETASGADLGSRAMQTETELNEARQANEDLASKIGDLHDLVVSQRNRAAELAVAFEELGDELTAAQSHVVDLEAKISNSVKAVIASQTHAADLEVKLNTLTAQIHSEKLESDEREREISDAEASLASELSRKDSLIAQRSSLEQSLQEAGRTILDLETELGKLEILVDQGAQHKIHLASRLDRLQNQIDADRADASSLAEQVQVLESRLPVETSKRDTLLAQMEQLQAELDSCLATTRSAADRVQALELQLAAEAQRRSELEDKLPLLRSDLASIMADADAVATDVSALEAELSSESDRKAALGLKVDLLRSQLRAVQDSILETGGLASNLEADLANEKARENESNQGAGQPESDETGSRTFSTEESHGDVIDQVAVTTEIASLDGNATRQPASSEAPPAVVANPPGPFNWKRESTVVVAEALDPQVTGEAKDLPQASFDPNMDERYLLACMLRDTAEATAGELRDLGRKLMQTLQKSGIFGAEDAAALTSTFRWDLRSFEVVAHPYSCSSITAPTYSNRLWTLPRSTRRFLPYRQPCLPSECGNRKILPRRSESPAVNVFRRTLRASTSMMLGRRLKRYLEQPVEPFRPCLQNQFLVALLRIPCYLR